MQAIDFKPLRAALAVAITVLVLAACTPSPTRPEQGAQISAQSVELEKAGNYQAAAQVYRDLAAKASAPDKQTYQLQAAAVLIRGKLLAPAKEQLAGINDQALDAHQKLQKQLLSARIALAEEQPELALQQVPSVGADAPAEVQRDVHLLRAQAYQAVGNYLESVRERIDLEPLLPDQDAVDQNHRAIWYALSQLSLPALQQLQTATPQDTLGGWLELAVIFDKARLDASTLQSDLDAWRARYPQHPAAGQFATELLAQQQKLQQRPARIALLLPLSGNLAEPARAIRDGFLAAHYSHRKDQNVSIRIYDTAQLDIWSLYNRVVQDGVDFIVGPLDKQKVSMLARAGEPAAPILALNAAEQPDLQTSAKFYQFGLAPEDEARQVAERASLEGFVHALAIVPEGDWGTRVLNAFSERFQQLGGQVLQNEQYDMSKSDFSAPIRRMLNLDESRSRHRMLERITGKNIKFEPRRRQDVDFVFMAAFPRQARLIAPQLRFYHAADLPVYTISDAYAGTPDRDADRDMDGVTFCDAPWTLSRQQDPLQQALQQDWPHEMARYARLFALGIDAYNILPYLDWLHQEPQERFEGQTGRLYVDSANRVHRTLEWARFVAGRAQVLQMPVIPARATATATQSETPAADATTVTGAAPPQNSATAPVAGAGPSPQ